MFVVVLIARTRRHIDARIRAIAADHGLTQAAPSAYQGRVTNYLPRETAHHGATRGSATWWRGVRRSDHCSRWALSTTGCLTPMMQKGANVFGDSGRTG